MQPCALASLDARVAQLPKTEAAYTDRLRLRQTVRSSTKIGCNLWTFRNQSREVQNGQNRPTYKNIQVDQRTSSSPLFYASMQCEIRERLTRMSRVATSSARFEVKKVRSVLRTKYLQ